MSPPVNKRQNNHLASQLQAQLEKVASNSLATIGARSSFSGARLAHELPRSFLVAAIIFPLTKWLKKITDYRDTPALMPDKNHGTPALLTLLVHTFGTSYLILA